MKAYHPKTEEVMSFVENAYLLVAPLAVQYFKQFQMLLHGYFNSGPRRLK